MSLNEIKNKILDRIESKKLDLSIADSNTLGHAYDQGNIDGINTVLNWIELEEKNIKTNQRTR